MHEDGPEQPLASSQHEDQQEFRTSQEEVADLLEKQKRQAKRVNYQDLGDQEFEAMLMNEERQYQAAKRRKLEARGHPEVRLKSCARCNHQHTNGLQI